jgi:hypothetical protein
MERPLSELVALLSRSRTPFGRPCLSLDDAACLQLELAGALIPHRPRAVMILVPGVWAFVRALLVNSAAVSLENVVLRHQLAVLQRSGGRPRLRRRDRILLGLSLTALGELAREPDPRPPRNGRRMAFAKGSVSTGAGSPGAAQRVALR